ncbi:MAG: hypothetical protein KBC38_01870 [Candidatus Pacebacteria bacterium]|nr:hypothetical protein [Candidatus Paceibacterota bacterium]MBP9840041.1 hypothetical protein [Candidatus Paceibacterota bacterium]
MAQEKEITLTEALASASAFVTYVPLRTEVPFRDIVTLPANAITYEIAPRASLDPFQEAEKAIAAVTDRKTAILIPGRRLDATGTRHGQGGGWYDRFLSKVPKEWTRIGFCYERQFSVDPIPRESWDQQMDLVIVLSRDGAVREYAARRSMVD